MTCGARRPTDSLNLIFAEWAATRSLVEHALFDHQVRPQQQRVRNRQAERFGSLEIDHEFELGRLHDWQVRRLFALENSPRIDAGLTIGI